MLEVYQLNFAGLLGLCGILFAASHKPSKSVGKPQDSKNTDDKKTPPSPEASQWSFLVVFALVMGADWLQGPFLYSLYREEHGLTSHFVSTLFTIGFVSGAASAYVTGSLADKYGRKKACQFFCIAYSLSCFLTMISSIPLLIIGRVLGGISTSLLFSVFESWMVTDFHNRALGTKGANLSRTFGLMSTLNSLVAIFSGVSSEWLVSVTATRKSPFAASAALLGIAFWLVSSKWAENYGDAAASQKKDSKPEPSKVLSLLKDPRIVCLGLASTMFEGSMYLFVFFWSPALQSVQTTTGGLPYGIIFASFMASILAASLAFNIAMDRRLLKYSQLLLGLLFVADACFYFLEDPQTEQSTFWLFCLFEACVGMYWPCMGYLKGQLVEDGIRAQVYGILRIPLNMFVVVSLLFTGEGDAYGKAFAVCSRVLLAACGGLWAMILNEDELP